VDDCSWTIDFVKAAECQKKASDLLTKVKGILAEFRFKMDEAKTEGGVGLRLYIAPPKPVPKRWRRTGSSGGRALSDASTFTPDQFGG
jgi:hypothetical protein